MGRKEVVGKVLSISHIKFKVIKEIPRCSATNIKPKTSDLNLNIPLKLKKNIQPYKFRNIFRSFK